MNALDLHPFVQVAASDKALGAIIGAALGDTVGLYTEFLPRTACQTAYPKAEISLVEPQTAFREDSHRDKFSPGEWTDDTDQALLIILSFLHRTAEGNTPIIDATDIAIRINIWISQGMRCLDRPPLGIGQTIGRVVLDPEYLKDPAKVALKIWTKSNRNAAANGSLMRTHPLGVMCIGKSLEETFQVAADIGRVTHVDPRCVVSCCLATGILRGILRGEIISEHDLDGLIQEAYEWVEGHEYLKNPELRKMDAGVEHMAGVAAAKPDSRLNLEEYRKHCNAQSLRELQLDDSQKMGYVYKCLGCAVLSLRLAIRYDANGGYDRFENFKIRIMELIMEGGDADTNGCVAGAFLGAWVGYSRLPPQWELGIKNRDWLLQKAHTLTLKVGLSPPWLDSSRTNCRAIDPDTAHDGGKGMLTQAQLDRRERDFVMFILTKQKDRRDKEIQEKKAKNSLGLGNWFK